MDASIEGCVRAKAKQVAWSSARPNVDCGRARASSACDGWARAQRDDRAGGTVAQSIAPCIVVWEEKRAGGPRGTLHLSREPAIASTSARAGEGEDADGDGDDGALDGAFDGGGRGVSMLGVG